MQENKTKNILNKYLHWKLKLLLERQVFDLDKKEYKKNFLEGQNKCTTGIGIKKHLSGSNKTDKSIQPDFLRLNYPGIIQDHPNEIKHIKIQSGTLNSWKKISR